MNRSVRLLLLTILLLLVCTACFGRSDEIDPLKEENVTLKIFTNQINVVENRYLDVLRLYFPNLNFIVIDEGYSEAVSSGDWEKWLDYHQPDLVMSFGQEVYQQLIQEELVIPLDTYIRRDDYSLDRFVPGPIEWLRRQSPDNQLYGLATEFYHDVIYYNKELFDELKIPYPNVQMSWIELMQTARRFQESEEGVYGLQVSGGLYPPHMMIYEAAFAEGLNLFDVEKQEVYIRSEAWKEIFEEVISTVQAGVIHFEYATLPENAAMVISEFNFEFNDLKYAANTLNEKWDVIHYPVHNHNPMESHKLRVDNPISIYRDTSHPDLAWELLKFMTGPELERYEQGAYSLTLGIPTWIDYIEQSPLENKHVFYDVMPSDREFPYYGEDYQLIYPVMRQKIDAVISGNQELDEALLELEMEIEKLLTEGAIY